VKIALPGQRHSLGYPSLPTHGKLLTSEFEQKGYKLNVIVQGRWVFNVGTKILRAALAGADVAYLPEDMVEQYVAGGRACVSSSGLLRTFSRITSVLPQPPSLAGIQAGGRCFASP